MKISKTLLFSFLLITSFACKRESDNHRLQQPAEQKFQFDIGKETNFDLSGVITNELGTPILGAKVYSGGQETTTDEFGFFLISQVTGNQKLSLVRIEAPGYYSGSRSFIPQAGMNQVSIRLMELVFNGSIDAETGGTISAPGCELELGKGFINVNTGKTHIGEVKVALRHLNPTSDNFTEIMPGNLIAASESGPRILESFGMIAVELRDKAGNKIQLSDANSATIHMDLPDEIKIGAPKSIPLWYFDESSGLWQEEGKAILENDEYVGQVEHFTLWNCDLPREYNTIEAKVINSSSKPIAGIQLIFKAENGETGFCRTNNEGFFKGLVPSDMKFSVDFKYNGGLVSTRTIGPITSDQTLDDIVLTQFDNLIDIVIPIIDCNEEPLNGGYVMIGNRNCIKIDSKGLIRFSIPPNQSIAFRILDKSGKYSGHNLAGQASSTTVDPIKHCVGGSGGGGSIPVEKLIVEYEFNDSTYYYIKGMVGFSTARGGTGDYISIDLGYSPDNPAHTSFLGLELKDYSGPKDYTITNQSKDMSFWLGNRYSDTTHYADSVNIKVNEFSYVDKVWILDLNFSGRMNYWNPETKQYEFRNVSNGMIKWTDVD